MTVHLLMASLSGGGAEHQLKYLADFLAEKGYDVSLVTFADVPDHYVVDERVKRIRIAEKKSNWFKLISLWHFLLGVKTDSLIVFSQRNSCFALPPLFFRRKIKVICGERNLTVGPPSIYEKLLGSFLYKRANYIVSNSYSQAAYLREKYPHFASRCLTIINYTDLTKFSPVKSINHTTRIIGVFARFDEQKNCLNFAKGVKMAKDILHSSFQIIWYGNHSNGKALSSEYVRLQSYIRENGLDDFFILKDEVKDPSIIMGNLDIICLPSLFEGFSNSIAEAICSGKPLIVSDVSDNHLMVEKDFNGYLFDPNSIHEIAMCIKTIIELPYSELLMMGDNSRRRAEQLFNKDIFISSYLSILK